MSATVVPCNPGRAAALLRQHYWQVIKRGPVGGVAGVTYPLPPSAALEARLTWSVGQETEHARALILRPKKTGEKR